MSLGDDGGYGDTYGDQGQTRTRLPDSGGEGYGTGRRFRTGLSSRNLVTIVGVVVLLIAAIAFANRGGGDDDKTSGSGGDKDAAAAPTAPSGVKPVDGKNGGIASGFAKTEQGAQSAAANYAVALVSANILKPDERHAIVQQVFAPAKVDEMQAKLDRAYSTAFLKKVGLDSNGNAPKGTTYISRTVPVGTKVIKLDGDTANLEVWCTGLFGTAGASSTTPVTSDWFTMQLELQWVDGDWKVRSFAQKEGPAPVNGDNKTSGADQIAEAVDQFGGFTYAR